MNVAMLKAIVDVQGTPEAQAKLFAMGGHVDALTKSMRQGLAGAAHIAGEALIGVGVVGVAAFAGLVGALASCVKESSDAELELAQTNAVLKSTHDASGQTAQSVLNLADKFSHLTMFTDDAVQSAENVLLTFTGIGKSIFPQATQAVLDLSQAMGQDWKQSAIEVGKALNDPVKGLGNLQRIGVSFTEEQKKMIKQFMATGDVLDAQKIILGELNKEFGNSAIAAGKTLPGQLKILSQNFDDVKQTIGDAVKGPLKGFVEMLNSQVVPVLKSGAKWVADFLGAMNKPEAQKALGDLGKAFGDLGGAINNIISIFAPFGVHVGSAKDAAHNFSQTIEKVAGFIKTLAEGINNAKPTILAIKAWLEEAARKIKKEWDDLQPTFKTVWGIIQQIGNFVKDTFAPVWKQLQDTLKQLKPQWDAFVAALQPAMPAFKLIGQIIGGIVVLAFMAFVKWLAMMATGAVLAFGIVSTIVLAAGVIFSKVMTGISDAVKRIVSDWNTVKTKAATIWAAVMKAISDAVETGKKWIQDKFNTAIQWIKDTWNGLIKLATSWGTDIINNFLAGLQAAWTSVVTWFNNQLAWLKGLWPGSPVKHGPLKGYENWGFVLAQGIASGLMRGTPLVQSAMAGLLGGTGMGSMNISHSFSDGMASPPAFMGGGGGQPIIINKIYVQSPDINLDGHQVVQRLGPHLAYEMQVQNARRRPA